jgi:uncharacterized protein involved in type VI secretion and phage assembly
VDISENFDGESAVDGNGYKWDVVIGNDWGGTNKALSLTANDGKSILKVPNGMGSKTKDVKMTFKAGSVKSFMQNTATWDLSQLTAQNCSNSESQAVAVIGQEE